MLSMFKKKPVIDVPAVTLPPPLNSNQENFARDPKTGESIYQRVLTPEQRVKVTGALNANIQASQQFLQTARQIRQMEKMSHEADMNLIASEKQIGDVVTKIRDEMKLDRRWGLNPQLMVMERRDPPAV